jgi:hypothetical protein
MFYLSFQRVFFCIFHSIFCQQCLGDCCFYRVFTWGWGVHGQLGHHSVEDCHTPTLVERLIGKVSCQGNSFIEPSLLTCINKFSMLEHTCYLDVFLAFSCTLFTDKTQPYFLIKIEARRTPCFRGRQIWNVTNALKILVNYPFYSLIRLLEFYVLPVEISMIKLRFFATALQKRLCCDKS